MGEHSPSYYAVIPAPVRYDDQIPANAKLLYGEISALIGNEGYCYASNGYFANLFKLSERTVSSLIGSLKDAGYIIVQVLRDKSGKVTERKLWLSASAVDGQPVENFFYTPGKYFREGIEENFQYTNLSNTEKKKIKKEKAKPQLTLEEMRPLFMDWIQSVELPGWSRQDKNDLYKSLNAFYDPDRLVKKGLPPVRSKQGFTAMGNLLKKWANGSPQTMMEIIDTAISNGWVGIKPPGNAPAEKPVQKERQYKCV